MKKILSVLLFSLLAAAAHAGEPKTLLNVSYDPTREFYEEYNAEFAKHWKEKTGEDVSVRQSHGGSGKQARAVIDGLDADVVTLALALDVDAIAERTKSIPLDWQTKLPHNSAPYTSTIIFLVRKDNPKQIKDWNDLIREDVKVITANPKTSGASRWAYLAAWSYALKHNNQSEDAAKDFVSKLYKNVAVMDTGARGSTTTFAQRRIGDILVSWENEAYLAKNELGKDKFDIVYPSSSILAEPPVAVVEKNANHKGNLEVARAYVEYLYSKPAQELAVKHYYRPIDTEVAAAHKNAFPPITLSKITELGGWKEVQKKHFDDGGIFDQIYVK
jgi:sulfate/thiosulfate-binding protein